MSKSDGVIRRNQRLREKARAVREAWQKSDEQFKALIKQHEDSNLQVEPVAKEK
jgi:hypothetical protein